MKRFISLFTMMMFLFVGTAMAQAPNDEHDVSVTVQEFAFIEVLGGDVEFDINALNFLPGQAGGSLANVTPDPGQTINGGNTHFQIHDTNTSLLYGTNALSAQVAVEGTGGSLANLDFGSYGGLMDGYINPLPYNNGGNTGTLGGNKYRSLDPGAEVLLSGISQGAAEMTLRYRVRAPYLQAPQNVQTTTVTYTIGANVGGM